VALQNRVAPTGELAAVPARGLLMGNRGGQFHRPDRTLGRRRWASRAWIACVLEYKGWREQIWVDRHYTQLFFLDEAAALAAGHRPCALCRRADYRRFAELWAETSGLVAPPKAAAMDDVLHAERWASRTEPTAVMRPVAQLPDGAVVVLGDAPHLVKGGRLWRWTFEGYRPGSEVASDILCRLVTPPTILGILAAGYQPKLHPSVGN
jgi:hypothetical protein